MSESEKKYTGIWVSKVNRDRLKKYKPMNSGSFQEFIMKLLDFYLEHEGEENVL